MDFIYNIIKRAYLSNKITRKIITIFVINKEGGQFYSKTLRRIFKETYDINVGIGTYGCFSTNFRPHVNIGSYCSIAPGVQRLVGNHPISNVSTHPLFYKKELGGVKETKYEYHKLTIGHDVWIGVNAIITGNVDYIGNGAIIGAGSIVTHNVEPYTIVAGNPAKTIRKRFDQQTIEKIEKSRWWELSDLDLRKIADSANDIDLFLSKVAKIRSNGQNK